MKDTGKRGGMFKDQVYLRGAYALLKKRHEIDFRLLYAGKLNLKDFARLYDEDLIITGRFTRQFEVASFYE